MTLRIGESQVLNFDRVTRAAVGNEGIADIAVLSGNQILVNGKTAGATTLLVWDRRGQNTFELTVVPEVQNVQALASVIRRDVDNPGIQVRAVGNGAAPAEVPKAPEAPPADAPNPGNVDATAPPPVP